MIISDIPMEPDVPASKKVSKLKTKKATRKKATRDATRKPTYRGRRTTRIKRRSSSRGKRQ